MKIFSVILFLLAFVACTAEDSVYSCDPKMDGFIKDNLSEIQNLTRSDFNKMTRNVQPAMFNALSADKKQKMWKEKINEVLKLDWTEKEKQHIQLLLQQIENNYRWYEEPVTYQDEIDSFAYKWLDYAKEELQWEQKTVYHIVFCLNSIIKNGEETAFLKEEEEQGNTFGVSPLVLKARKEYPDEPATVNCTCKEELGDKYDSCGTTGLMDCKKWNCKAVYGCGFAFQQVCDGGCFRNDLG